MERRSPSPTPPPAPVLVAGEPRFVNAMRLSLRQWTLVASFLAAVLLATPWVWQRIERFDTGLDYRIPYALSKDYWLYERRLHRITPSQIAVVGDSVVWGEYVRPDGTLSHFLNEQSETPGRFLNAGVNGLFPLALEGLVRYYGGSLHGGRVLLHCNVLWMSSPKADLHTEKEQRFNHADLVPQFLPRIPCYRASADQRLAAVVDRHFTFAQWVNHLQNAYFQQQNFLQWTLDETSGNPPSHPNAFKNPFAQITLTVPAERTDDPDRGPDSPRHKPWSTTGRGTTRFDWVPLEDSLQWAAFQRLVTLLQARNNDVLVVVGPFNEHIMAEENLPAFRRLREGIVTWLVEHHVKHIVPAVLPSELYADASHPLTEGYRLLAEGLLSESVTRAWLGNDRTAVR
ncbi:MAG: hypothetical protein H7A46_00960 [Verrucomicrobiales bacterium]|nr:hypothetical protein [Verrucomicrobiales bacterium]